MDTFEYIKSIAKHIINAFKYIQIYSNTRLDGLD
jgi:hypothetical protein